MTSFLQSRVHFCFAITQTFLDALTKKGTWHKLHKESNGEHLLLHRVVYLYRSFSATLWGRSKVVKQMDGTKPVSLCSVLVSYVRVRYR